MSIKALQNSFLLQALRASDIQTIYQRANNIKLSKNPILQSNIIFDKGDIGQCLYILVSGQIELTIFDNEDTEQVIDRLEKVGDYFGIWALLDSMQRRTVRAKLVSDSAELLLIDKKELYDIILAKQNALYLHLTQLSNQQRKEKSLIFAEFIKQQTDAVQEQSFNEGGVICKQGENSRRFHLILDGTAKVIQDNELVTELAEGNYFGELSLIENKPHSASVVAGQRLKTVSLAGDEFMQLYERSAVVRDYMLVMRSFYNKGPGVVLTQYKSHYKNQNSLSSILKYPEGQACSITRVVNNKHQLLFAKQVTIYDDNGNEQGSENIPLNENDIIKYQSDNKQSPVFYIQKNRLVAAEFTTEFENMEHIVSAIVEQHFIWPWQLALFRKKQDLWIKNAVDDISDNAVICSCMRLSRGDLKRAVAFGCNDAAQLARETGASLGCGVCASSVADIAASAKMEPVTLLPLSVDDKNNCTNNIKIFKFKPKNADIDSYQAGQHIRLEAQINNKWIQRCYTLTSIPNQQEYYEIAVNRTAKGVFSNWLHDQLTEQTELRVSKPQGQFHTNPNSESAIVFFVAGVGITPAIAALRDFQSKQHKQALYIDYSVRNNNDFGYLPELKKAVSTGCQLELRTTERRKKQHSDYNGIERRVTEGSNRITQAGVSRIVKKYPAAEFYICGSKYYEETVNNYLLNTGVEDSQIHSEQFNVNSSGTHTLMWTCIITILFTLLFFIIPSYNLPASVNALNESISWDNLDLLLDHIEYQRKHIVTTEVSGYTILALGVLGLSISLPRRWAVIRALNIGWWRIIHAALGILALIILYIHSGFAMGGIHTTLLISCFLVLMVLGAVSGMGIVLQEKVSASEFYVFKKWSRRLHIACSWPVPVLLATHIISTYLF